MSHAWMPFYVADYLADTGHLSALEHGAYMLLMMHYWQHEGLPTEDARLSRICRLTPKQWEDSRATLADFFLDGWRHKRIDFELSKATDIVSKRSAAGKAAAQARYNKRITSEPSNVAHTPIQTDTPSQPPSPRKHSVPNGTGAPRAPSTEEKTLFDRGKAVLGKGSGGLISKLLKAKDGSFSQALAAIELAANKQNPAEYIGAVLRAPAGATVNADGTFSRWAI